jgi:hypothetical protein
MPTDREIGDPPTDVDTNNETEQTQDCFHEQDERESLQLMQDEDGEYYMVVNDDSAEQSAQSKTAPTRGTGIATGKGVSDGNIPNANSRPKKLKLENRPERRTDRKRSRNRHALNKRLL